MYGHLSLLPTRVIHQFGKAVYYSYCTVLYNTVRELWYTRGVRCTVYAPLSLLPTRVIHQFGKAVY